MVKIGFKIVISDPKTRRAWQIEKELPILIGLKIGENIDGSVLGLNGFVLQIRGGSDKDGFPMRPDLQGVGRKKLLLASSPGYHPKDKGIKKRKYVRGNTITEEIVQVNFKVITGEGDAGEILGIKPKEKAEEKPKEEKKETKPEEKEVKEEKKEEKIEAKPEEVSK